MVSAHEMKGRHRAFVFVDVVPGKEQKVMERLLKYDEVIEVHIITGEHDVFAVLEFELYGREVYASVQETISKFVTERVCKIRGIKDTNTIIPTFSLTKRAE